MFFQRKDFQSLLLIPPPDWQKISFTKHLYNWLYCSRLAIEKIIFQEFKTENQNHSLKVWVPSAIGKLKHKAMHAGLKKE